MVTVAVSVPVLVIVKVGVSVKVRVGVSVAVSVGVSVKVSVGTWAKAGMALKDNKTVAANSKTRKARLAKTTILVTGWLYI